MSDVFDLIAKTRVGTQYRYIAEIFSSNIGQSVSSREVNTAWTFNYCFSQTNKPFNKEDWKNISSYDDINNALQKTFLDNDVSLPGDIQRQLRTFNDKFGDYGLLCDQRGKTPIYTWEPKSMEELDKIVPPAARNIFKTKKESDAFVNKKKNV